MAEQYLICPSCGQKCPPGTRFCTKCGAALTEPVPPAAEKEPSAPAVSVQQAAFESRIPADAHAGETALDLDAETDDRPDSVSADLKGPGAALLEALKGSLKGVLSLLKNPKSLIPLILIAVIWIILAWLQKRGSADAGTESAGSPVVRILSFLTFAGTGKDRSAAGLIGTAFGQGTVAAAWISLFRGGLKSLFRGISSVFRKQESKRGIVPLLLGAAAGLLLYFVVFAGIRNASGATAMAGIAGALVSLQGLGNRSGGLFRLALSLFSRKENGTRTASESSAVNLLSGQTLGFVLSAAVSALL